MRGSIRQRTPGSWEFTVELNYNSAGARRRKFEPVRGIKASPNAVSGRSSPPRTRDWLDRFETV